ncbi:MAG: YbaB/EbfC family nucleoid-associated protein [Gemmataceae bacterium]
MIDKLGGLMGLLANKGKIQEEMAKFQQRVAQITAEGTAGGGMVTVKANGKLEVTACRLSDEAVKLNDREMLEDLVIAATNQALGKVREQIAAETNKVAASLGLPPGMLGGGGFPGLG